MCVCACVRVCRRAHAWMCMHCHLQLFATPWTVALQARLCTEFSRQEYWSMLPFPIPGDLPNPGIEPMSLAPLTLASTFLTTGPPAHEAPLPQPLPNKFTIGLCFISFYLRWWASLVAQWWRLCPPMQEMWVPSLGKEDTLGKEMVSYSNILAWEISWTEELGRLQSMRSKKSQIQLLKNKHQRHSVMRFALTIQSHAWRWGKLVADFCGGKYCKNNKTGYLSNIEKQNIVWHHLYAECQK